MSEGEAVAGVETPGWSEVSLRIDVIFIGSTMLQLVSTFSLLVSKVSLLVSQGVPGGLV
jgi:hypothetical protein